LFSAQSARKDRTNDGYKKQRDVGAKAAIPSPPADPDPLQRLHCAIRTWYSSHTSNTLQHDMD